MEFGSSHIFKRSGRFFLSSNLVDKVSSSNPFENNLKWPLVPTEFIKFSPCPIFYKNKNKCWLVWDTQLKKCENDVAGNWEISKVVN
jgi:hypothetical protein